MSNFVFALIAAFLLLSIQAYAANTHVASFDSAREMYETQLSAPLNADAWDSCGTASDLFVIEEFTLTPDPPKAGSSLIVSVKGTLKETVASGTKISVKVKYNFITIYTLLLDLCAEAEKIPDAPQCPIAPGPLNISQTADIPGNAPPGRYNIRVEGVSDQEQPLFCVSLTFRL